MALRGHGDFRAGAKGAMIEGMPKAASKYSLAIDYYREPDGRWLADIPALPGVTAYGRTKKQATACVLRLLAQASWALPGAACLRARL